MNGKCLPERSTNSPKVQHSKHILWLFHYLKKQNHTLTSQCLAFVVVLLFCFSFYISSASEAFEVLFYFPPCVGEGLRQMKSTNFCFSETFSDGPMKTGSGRG